MLFSWCRSSSYRYRIVHGTKRHGTESGMHAHNRTATATAPVQWRRTKQQQQRHTTIIIMKGIVVLLLKSESGSNRNVPLENVSSGDRRRRSTANGECWIPFLWCCARCHSHYIILMWCRTEFVHISTMTTARLARNRDALIFFCRGSNTHSAMNAMKPFRSGFLLLLFVYFIDVRDVSGYLLVCIEFFNFTAAHIWHCFHNFRKCTIYVLAYVCIFIEYYEPRTMEWLIY